MYPEVMEFYESLGVDMESADTSFSVSLDEGQGYEWGTQNGLSSLFAQKKNILNPWFWNMIREISKFKGDAATYVGGLESCPDVDRNETLGHFVQSHGYSELFQKAYLIPLCACIWSCSSGVMSISAYSVLSFLCNLDVLQLLGHSQRLTPIWLSRSYVNRIKKALESRGCQVRTNSEVYSVLTNIEGCIVTCTDGSEEAFDGCIIATHAPDVVKILGNQATHDELRILGAFQYSNSDIFLHCDDNLMPKNQASWASRNFLGTINEKAYITYWLNNVQNISESGAPFLLTLNPLHTPKRTFYKWSTSHPIPSVAASKASSELNLIQGKRRLWFSGAYQGYGFPEDGVKAGILAANGFLRRSDIVQSNLRQMVPSYLETGARILVARFLERFITTGCLIFLEEGGTILTFEGKKRENTLKVTLRIHKPQFYWKVAKEADIGFADAYINGDFSFVDKDKGLLNFFLIIIANTEMNIYASKLNKKSREWWNPLFYTSVVASAKYFIKNVSKKNTLSQARRNISHIYDLSNELYSLFLDESMSYSCAIFQTPNEDFKTAQLRKVHVLIEKARIKKEHHILEIGCGWGTFAIEVVKSTGCKYTGITLSEKQLQYVEAEVKKAGLQDRIEVLFCDYRQLPKNCKYDRIIACEMIEHVGHEFMEEFFRCCDSALARNGLLILQFVSIADEKYDETRLGGFVTQYIFPGGCVPSLSHVLSAMAAASTLSVVHLEEIGCHYYSTLRHWRKNFLQNHSKILALGFNEKFIRTWEYYFDYCAAAFKYCLLGDYQIVFSRPGDVAAFGNDPYNRLSSAN